MAKAKRPFTLTRYHTIDDDGEHHEATDVDETKTDAELEAEGIHKENVNVATGDEVDVSDEERAGLAGYLEDEEAAGEASASSDDSQAAEEDSQQPIAKSAEK